MVKLDFGMGKKRGDSKPGRQDPACHVGGIPGGARAGSQAHAAGDDPGYPSEHNRGVGQALDPPIVNCVDAVGNLVGPIPLTG